jgi:hypothetical protein
MTVVSPTITSGVHAIAGEGAVVANAAIAKQQIATTTERNVFTAS